MFDLTFLGTSASVPSADRNHPGLLVDAGGHRIMVDCGEGTQRQLLRSGAGFRRLDRLLLTHGHFDHVLGIPGLFSTLRLRQSTDVMTIHGSPGTLDVVVRILAGLWGEGRAPIPLQLGTDPRHRRVHRRLFPCASSRYRKLRVFVREPSASPSSDRPPFGVLTIERFTPI
jgi:ribonuclease Z